MINLNNKIFQSIKNVGSGEVSNKTLFKYYQDGNIVWAEYSGGSIVKGNLIATMDESSKLDMRYHHINDKNELMTGHCVSTPEILSDGRIRFYETWTWTSSDHSSGSSIIEEVK